ncbi:MAG: ABC transporter permease [Solibacillus sp.]
MTFLQFAYRNVFRNFRNYAAFFMASFFSVFVFFLYTILMFHPEIEQGFLGEIPVAGMVFAIIILMLFSWFFILYSLRAFLSARSKEFAILLHLGMAQRQLGKLVVIETMIIGFLSSVSGILFGFAFSKFFLMIVREILGLEQLNLYISWEPFVLTLFVYLSAFIVISYVSAVFIPNVKIIDLLRGSKLVDASAAYSKRLAILGIALIVISYGLMMIITKTTLLVLTLIIPFTIVLGTYFFFTDSILFLLDLLKRKKHYYWKKSRMLTIAEQTQMMRNNAKMFFIVTFVSTLAFLTVGVLSAMSSYTSQYDKINPLGMIYKGHVDNPYESEHVTSLVKELEAKELSYQMTRFVVKRQTSSFTSNPVEVFRETDINHLLFSYGYPMVQLAQGEGMFIAFSEDAMKELKSVNVDTVLQESHVHLFIDTVYPEIIFPTSIVSQNSIIVSDEDFLLINQPFIHYPYVESGYHLFTFDVPNWVETKDIGVSIQEKIRKDYLENNAYTLPFYFENTGLSYSYILATYSLFTLVGILVVAVFLLAAGSFVYFKLYTNLGREKKQFDMLKRIGLTDLEMKKLVTRYLVPQFFLPWGLALVHSAFAFFTLQSILRDVLNIWIVKEVVVAFSVFVVIQVVYFYLIRWRYLAHIRE